MTVQNPALYLQSENHPAEDFRHLITKVFGGREGVVDTDGLTVVEAGTPNMTVDVSEGTVLIDGTEATYQGLYLAHNRGATSLAISASDPTNDRYDLVVAQVEDSDYSGAVSGWKLAVVTGAAAATPLFPTVPDNAFVLATVLVGNGVSSIVDADVTDIRSASDTDGTTTLGNTGFVSATGGTQVCTSTTRPSPVTGMEIYETDTSRKLIWSGSAWVITASPWFDWTPGFIGLDAIGNGALDARYCRIGDTVDVSLYFDVGTTTTFSAAAWTFSTPMAAANQSMRWALSIYARDGTDRYGGAALLVSNGTALQSIGDAGGSQWDATTPFTWTGGDYFVLTGSYETDAAA